MQLAEVSGGIVGSGVSRDPPAPSFYERVLTAYKPSCDLLQADIAKLLKMVSLWFRG